MPTRQSKEQINQTKEYTHLYQRKSSFTGLEIKKEDENVIPAGCKVYLGILKIKTGIGAKPE